MKILIVDDEVPARDRLRRLLEEDGGHDVVGEAANGNQALSLTEELSPDVVLLDVRMPGMDGIETARHLNGAENPPAVVFATAYDEYAIEAFKANAVGYVLKPIRRERLEQALAQASRLRSGALDAVAQEAGVPAQRNHLCTRSFGELKLIPIGDVRYVLADQKYVNVVHAGGEDLIDDSLKALEEEFPDRFVRIHRGALVALACIESLRKADDGHTEIVLRERASGDAERLVVSRRHLTNVKRRLKQG